MKIICTLKDRKTVSSSYPLRKNQYTLLPNTFNNTPHAPKKWAPQKRAFHKRSEMEHNITTNNSYQTAQKRLRS